MFKPFEQPAKQHTTAHSNDDWQSWDMEPLSNSTKSSKSEQATAAEQAQFERHSELQKLREEARQEAYHEGLQQGQKEGYQAGLEQGLKEGREQGLTEYTAQTKSALAPLGLLIKETDTALQNIETHMAESMLQLALTVGRQLAGEALAANPEQVLELIRAILHEDPMLNDKPVLLLHPDDLKLAQQHLEQELAAIGWKLRADDRLERGGCRLVSADGELDATIETRWQRIIHQLRGRHG
ncbi:flagellar assembly protein FliH [Pseudidiomarina gelatinasegens]|uniref:Flagellar assembly protein FliH n=1 Tax=Pseudidiomarina gelatinasegens TaxID=2487740 RepID=A0A443YZH7_9GAMM|nr:flagellar assembly protein FliH [Pseudidiomarina gelatinasegens]RWU09603.1 flagellar assembly protein FliH [Pseudidiomarina gelatinasegens]